MGNLVIFFSEVLLCLAISYTVMSQLKPRLQDILQEVCGTETRAEFWVVFTRLMIFIAPLLIVVLLAQTNFDNTINHVAIIKDTLYRSLLGVFIALAIIGQIIWKAILDMAKNQQGSLSGERKSASGSIERDW